MHASNTSIPGPGRSTYIIAILFLAWLFAYIDRQVIGLLVPSLKADMGLSDTQVSLLQGIAFSSVFALAGLPLGRVADRSNRRNLIALGVAVWSIATMACGLCSTFTELFAARMCVGLGEACIAPAAVSFIADTFRPEHRGKAISIMQVGAPMGTSSALFFGGMLLSSLTTGTLAQHLGPSWQAWQIVFLSAGAPGLLVALLVLTLREPARRGTITATPSPSEGKPAGLFRHFRTNSATFSIIYALYACLFIIGYAVSAWAPTILMRVHGMSPRTAGATYATVMLACSSTAYIFSGILSDYLSKRRPLDGRILLPIFLLPVELAAMATFFYTSSVTVTVAMLAVSSLSTGLGSTSSLPALQDIAPNAMRGQIVAVYLLIANLIGLGLAPTLVGLVTDGIFHDEMLVQQSSALVAFVAALLALALALTLPRYYRRTRLAMQDDAA